MRFDGKTAVVTGGALGIGRAVCQLLAERGAAVAILDIDERSGNELCSEIGRAGGNAMFERLDVSNPVAVKTAIEAAYAAFARSRLAVSAGFKDTERRQPRCEQCAAGARVNRRCAWYTARGVAFMWRPRRFNLNVSSFRHCSQLTCSHTPLASRADRVTRRGDGFGK